MGVITLALTLLGQIAAVKPEVLDEIPMGVYDAFKRAYEGPVSMRETFELRNGLMRAMNPAQFDAAEKLAMEITEAERRTKH